MSWSETIRSAPPYPLSRSLKCGRSIFSRNLISLDSESLTTALERNARARLRAVSDSVCLHSGVTRTGKVASFASLSHSTKLLVVLPSLAGPPTGTEKAGQPLFQGPIPRIYRRFWLGPPPRNLHLPRVELLGCNDTHNSVRWSRQVVKQVYLSTNLYRSLGLNWSGTESPQGPQSLMHIGCSLAPSCSQIEFSLRFP